MYNLKLSEKRALSIRNYIIANSIKKERVFFEGHGEKDIINKCYNYVKRIIEEHLMNRRTTFFSSKINCHLSKLYKIKKV